MHYNLNARKISLNVFLLSTFAITPAAVLAANNTLQNISVSTFTTKHSQIAKTVIDLQLTKSAKYKVFYLDSPARLVIDVENGTLKSKINKATFANTLVKNIRSAHKPSGALRVVFDLTQEVDFTQQAISENNQIRLNIIISPKSHLQNVSLKRNAYIKPNMQNVYSKPSMQKAVNANVTDSSFRALPRVTANGYTGSHTFADGELMVPIVADMQQNFYGVLEGGFGVKNIESEFGGAGLGYRFLTNQNSRILGFYALGDYLNTEARNGFWSINPGVESLGELWDFRLNGYIPVSERKKKENEQQFFASDRGLSQFEFFQGHDFFDQLINVTSSEKDGYGADAEIGRKIPELSNLKLFVGGYRFQGYESDSGFSSVNGISARAQLPINDYVTVEARDSYDKEQHNSAIIGVKLSLGGISNKDQYGISGRLMDPIEHNLAATSGWNVEGMPTQQIHEENIIGERLKLDHIWFFQSLSPMALAGPGDGTFEHPFQGIDPGKMSIIKADPAGQNYANLFFAPGTYTLGSFSMPVGRLPLPVNYSMYGRTADYKFAASGDNRALFFGGIDIQGGNTFDSIQLLNDGNQTRTKNGIFNGIRIDPAVTTSVDNLSFNNVDVGVSNDFSQQYQHAVDLSAKSISINNISNSNFNGNGDASDNLNGGVLGMKVTGIGGDVAINNIFNSNFSGVTSGGIVYGLLLTATGDAIVGNISQGNFTAEGDDSFDYGMLISTANNATVGNISHSNFTAVANGVSTNIYGAFLISTNNIALGDITNSSFQATSNGEVIYGMNVQSTNGNIGIGDILNSKFYASCVNNSNGNVIGLNLLSELGNIEMGDISNSIFYSNGVALDFGLSANAKSNITISDIIDSSFVNTSSGPNPANFSTAGMSLITGSAGNIAIDNISNNIFASETTSVQHNYGMYLSSPNISIANIAESAFTYNNNGSTLLGYGIYSNIPGAIININFGSGNIFSDSTHHTNF